VIVDEVNEGLLTQLCGGVAIGATKKGHIVAFAYVQTRTYDII